MRKVHFELLKPSNESMTLGFVYFMVFVCVFSANIDLVIFRHLLYKFT